MARANAGRLASKIGTGTVLSVLSALLLPLWLTALGAWCVQLVALALIQHQQGGGGHFLMVRERPCTSRSFKEFKFERPFFYSTSLTTGLMARSLTGL